MRCAGQLRLAPDGTVLGIDMNVALGMAEALGYDTAAIVDFLPEAGAGLREGLSQTRAEGDPERALR